MLSRPVHMGRFIRAFTGVIPSKDVDEDLGKDLDLKPH